MKANEDKYELFAAEHMGFCFGVKNAVEMARRALSEGRGSRCVCSCGSIIHNERVMAGLSKQGLKVIGDLESAPEGAVLLVRSHGEGRDFFARAEERGLRVINATCPKVERIQKLAEEADKNGDLVVIVGDESHPEVRGINGWCGGRAVIIGDETAAESIAADIGRGDRGVVLMAQTTFDESRFSMIVNIITGNGHEPANHRIKVMNTICEATRNRQRSAAKLAEKVDAMIVVGDKNSSNSGKLFDIVRKTCKKTFFIENSSDIPLKDIVNCNKIGITAGASTPEQIIKEVISRMREIKNEGNETNPMHEFMDEIDKSLRLPRNGEIITGEVIQVTEKDVIVNIGCKKDGVIPRNEVTLEPDQTLLDLFKEGDEVQAKVLKNDDGDGNILLSKKRVVISEHWEDINAALEEKSNIEVTVVKDVNGGVIASFHEISGFIPVSQLSDRFVETTEEFIGKTFLAKVMRVDQKRNKVVFSHKAVLNEERLKRMHEVWDTLNVGDIIDGKIMRFTEYGAFVDIGGIDGLLHISEISWGKLRHPEEVLSIDQEIKVKILSMNKDKEKISLGYKQNLPEPWSIINEKYQVGQMITGKAVQLKEYGVFVELEPGLDGLVHISEVSHTRINNIAEEIKVGQDVTAKILEIDKDRKRISLSIKESMEKPEGTDDEYEGDAAADGEPDATIGEKIIETAGDVIEKVGDAAENAASHVAEKIEDFKDNITEAAEDFVEGVKETVQEIVEVADEAMEKVHGGYEDATVPTEYPIEEDTRSADPETGDEPETPEADVAETADAVEPEQAEAAEKAEDDAPEAAETVEDDAAETADEDTSEK